jgi:hypothetical protein
MDRPRGLPLYPRSGSPRLRSLRRSGRQCGGLCAGNWECQRDIATAAILVPANDGALTAPGISCAWLHTYRPWMNGLKAPYTENPRNFCRAEPHKIRHLRSL